MQSDGVEAARGHAAHASHFRAFLLQAEISCHRQCMLKTCRGKHQDLRQAHGGRSTGARADVFVRRIGGLVEGLSQELQAAG